MFPIMLIERRSKNHTLKFFRHHWITTRRWHQNVPLWSGICQKIVLWWKFSCDPIYRYSSWTTIIIVVYNCEFYQSKGRKSPIPNTSLLHQNTWLHTTALIQPALINLEHPPYSPDLPPCDYHLLGPYKICTYTYVVLIFLILFNDFWLILYFLLN